MVDGWTVGLVRNGYIFWDKAVGIMIGLPNWFKGVLVLLQIDWLIDLNDYVSGFQTIFKNVYRVREVSPTLPKHEISYL